MLNTLRRIVYEVNAASDIETGLQAAVRGIRRAVHADVASIFLLNKEQSRFFLVATDGLNQAAIGKASLDLSEGLIGQVAQREEPLNIENAPQHPDYCYLQEIGEERLLSFLGVPIIHYRQLLGVLVVQNFESGRFAQSEEAFLVTLSVQLADAIALVEATEMVTKYSSHKQSACYSGIAAASGVGIGEVVVYYPKATIEAIPERFSDDLEQEVSRLRKAIEAVRQDIKSIAVRVENTLGPEEGALFTAYLRILDDSSLGGEIAKKIIDDKLQAESALASIVREHVRQFELMDDAYIRDRVVDVKDLGLRVLTKLETEQALEKAIYPDRTVLVGEEITASMLAEVPRDKLVAVVSVKGAINSHMSIVARSLAVPTVVGVLGLPVSQLDKKLLIVDGYRGEVVAYPTKEMITQYEEIVSEEREISVNLDKLVDREAITVDGVKVCLWVNTGLTAEVPKLIRDSISGVGLYRSEVPFMAHDRFPSEEEQAVIYRKQLEVFSPSPVTMRTLDIGGDKQLPYFPIYEENPALGWRGIRVLLDHPEIFLVQVRAMLKASSDLNNLRILLPMVSTVYEIEQARQLIDRAYDEVLQEGFKIVKPSLGVMIEVPAAVYQTCEFAKKVDFISVGSNDLAQYLLAVDRNNPRVASLYSSYHPALLLALKTIVDQAKEMGKPVSICGEMAGDPGSALLLIAMGYEQLSMSAANLLKVKSAICQVSMSAMEATLKDILAMDNAEVIRKYLEHTLEQKGLVGLLRPLGNS